MKYFDNLVARTLQQVEVVQPQIRPLFATEHRVSDFADDRSQFLEQETETNLAAPEQPDRSLRKRHAESSRQEEVIDSRPPELSSDFTPLPSTGGIKKKPAVEAAPEEQTASHAPQKVMPHTVKEHEQKKFPDAMTPPRPFAGLPHSDSTQRHETLRQEPVPSVSGVRHEDTESRNEQIPVPSDVSGDAETVSHKTEDRFNSHQSENLQPVFKPAAPHPPSAQGNLLVAPTSIRESIDQSASLNDAYTAHPVQQQRQFRSQQDTREEGRSSEPTVHVTIGRIEIRAVSPPQALKAPRPSAPTMSLEEYLQRRAGNPR